MSERDAITARFVHPLWQDASDAEIAETHNVRADYVRELRAAWRRDIAIGALLSRAHEIAAQHGWPGTDAEFLAECLETVARQLEVRAYRRVLAEVADAAE